MSSLDKFAVIDLAHMIGMSAEFVLVWFVRNNIARADFSYAVATMPVHKLVSTILNDKAL